MGVMENGRGFVNISLVVVLLTVSSTLQARSLWRRNGTIWRRNTSECQMLYSAQWRWFSFVDTVFGRDEESQGAEVFQAYMKTNWAINDIKDRQEVRRWACAFADARSTVDIATALHWPEQKARTVQSNVSNWCNSVLNFQGTIYHYQPDDIGRRYVTKMFYFCRQLADLHVIRENVDATISRPSRHARDVNAHDIHKVMLLP